MGTEGAEDEVREPGRPARKVTEFMLKGSRRTAARESERP